MNIYYKQTFEEEYTELLTLHEIEYDERYLFGWFNRRWRDGDFVGYHFPWVKTPRLHSLHRYAMGLLRLSNF